MDRRLNMSTITMGLRAGALGPVAALALVAAPAAVVPSAAMAAAARPAAPTFALSSADASGALRLRGRAGQTVSGAVTVRNVSSHQITVRLQPADIRNAANGNADYITTVRSATGRWLHLGARNVRLTPHATRRITFTLNVPANATGASHYAGIVAVDAADLTRAAQLGKRGKKSSNFSFARINRQALPITVRLPGPLTRSLTLRSTTLDVKPAGAGLVLALRPGGTVLTPSARVTLRVSRGARTVLTHASTLGQLFPGSGLRYRIPWRGRPTAGTYHVTGLIRPAGSAPVTIDTTIVFTPAGAKELKRVTPPVAGARSAAQVPAWVWPALAVAAGLLIALSIAVARLMRRSRTRMV